MAKFGKLISIYKILDFIQQKLAVPQSPRNHCCKATVSLCNAQIEGRTAEAGIREDFCQTHWPLLLGLVVQPCF